MDNLSNIYQVWTMIDFYPCVDSPIKGYMNVDSLYQLDFTHRDKIIFIDKEGEEVTTKSYQLRNDEVQFEGTDTKLKIVYLSEEELKVIYHASAQGVSIEGTQKIKGDLIELHYKTT